MKNHTLLSAVCIVMATLALGCRRDPVEAGIRAIENGDLQQAETLLAAVLEQDPGNVNALMNLSIARLKAGDAETALQGFRKVADLARDDSRPLEYMAAIYMDNNQWREASDVLTEAAGRDPRSPSILTAQALVDLYTAGAPAARERLTHVLAMAPTYPPALFNLAVIERDWMKTPVEGRKYFQRYLAVAKNETHSPIARAALLEKAPVPRRSASSSPLPQKSVAAPTPTPPTPRDPRKAMDAFSQGVRLHQTGKTTEAIREYLTAIQNDPAMAKAHFNLGLLLREKGDYQKARDAFESAVNCAPDMTDARYMLGLTLSALGDDTAAATQFKSILEKAPKHAASHLALGLIYKKDKTKLAEARRELSAYLALDPDGASAKDVKNWLKYQR